MVERGRHGCMEYRGCRSREDEPCWIRTSDPLLKRQLLCLTELTAQTALLIIPPGERYSKELSSLYPLTRLLAVVVAKIKKAVSNSALGNDIVGIAWVGFDLLAKVGNIEPE
jgi:hypothetical protein